MQSNEDVSYEQHNTFRNDSDLSPRDANKSNTSAKSSKSMRLWVGLFYTQRGEGSYKFEVNVCPCVYSLIFVGTLSVQI